MTRYISTRGGGQPQSFEDVLLAGLAPDGGLYVPEQWPHFSEDDLKALEGKSYIEIAEAVMSPFIGDAITPSDFRAILEATYGPANFRHEDVVPLHKISDRLYALELFHGPTIAFKDVALQLLGRLFDHVLTRRNEHVTIVGATSGDTGSAAIEGCRVGAHVDIFILHPKGRVSDVQRRQMTTIDAPNVHNIALEGTFDDCQNMVKAMFADEDFRSTVNLSAVNSINWARIMAQIVYYFTASLKLRAEGHGPASFVVPTGNFGNVFAAYCARKMGLPIERLAISTNRNDILTRFFETGEMKLGEVHPTISPSMDIQISSNFERYLFDLLGRDAARLREVMETFKTTGHVVLSGDLLDQALEEFSAHRSDDETTLATIKNCHEKAGYVLDPHTAVGMHGALEILEQVKGPVVSLACAHPAKFPDAVKKATGIHPELPPHLSDLFAREEHLNALPNDLGTVQNFVKENIG